MELDHLVEKDPDPHNVTPKQAMWERIHKDYIPSTHPSYITYKPPESNKPTPAILAGVVSCS